jgi:hypothetical protein
MTIRSVPFIFILALALAIFAVAGWLFTARTHAQERTSDPWQVGGPHKVVDNAARAVTPDDETSVRALTETIFSYPHAYGRMPTEFESTVKDSLTQAEIQHLRGNRPGVKEGDVAKLVNQWVDKLHLPEYAKTSAKQVRVLRMSLAAASPAFMGRNLTDPNTSATNTISPEMSLLQAVHLATVLLDQKFLDPDYQLTPEEWEGTFQKRQVEKLQRQQELMRAVKPGQYMIGTRSNPKMDKMRQSFTNGISNLGTADASDLVKSSLETVGIR